MRECTLEGKTGYAGVFASNPPRFSNAGNLFKTRDEAVAEAEARVARMHDAYVRAGQRWTKARETVAKLKAESPKG